MSKRTISTICLILALFYHAHPVLADETKLQDQDNENYVQAVNTPVEPNIRVLLGLVTKQTSVVVGPSSTLVLDNLPTPLTATATIAVSFLGKKVTVKKDGKLFGTGAQLRLIPASPQVVSTIANFSRPLKGHKALYNEYRGSLVWQPTKDKKSMALVNSLPLESYVAGLTENSPGDPQEFVKALVVAARSYAFVRLGNTRLPYDVEASTNDQLYLGYQSELRLPNVVAAAQATRGEMVYYDGTVVSTNYFSHSNGTTLDWDATHKDSRPWLKAKEAMYDTGLKRSGHGYGMSLHDAIARAKKDAWFYTDILTYYYDGTVVQSGY